MFLSGSSRGLGEIEEPGGEVARSSTSSTSPKKLMCPFDEKRNDLDAYSHRLARLRRQVCPKNEMSDRAEPLPDAGSSDACCLMTF